MQTQQISVWKGSLNTADAVRQEIAERYGEEEAKSYNPMLNCFTFQTWWAKGFVVKKGEKAIKSYTLKAATITENGENVVKKYFKPVYLFYWLQVEKR
jgi:hypothetical protein